MAAGPNSPGPRPEAKARTVKAAGERRGVSPVRHARRRERAAPCGCGLTPASWLRLSRSFTPHRRLPARRAAVRRMSPWSWFLLPTLCLLPTDAVPRREAPASANCELKPQVRRAWGRGLVASWHVLGWFPLQACGTPRTQTRSQLLGLGFPLRMTAPPGSRASLRLYASLPCGNGICSLPVTLCPDFCPPPDPRREAGAPGVSQAAERGRNSGALPGKSVLSSLPQSVYFHLLLAKLTAPHKLLDVTFGYSVPE